MPDIHLNLDWLHTAYTDRLITPSKVIEAVYSRVEADGLRPTWITLVDRSTALARANLLETSGDVSKYPLFGVPFAVKDNIDVAGMPTTAACPAFAFTPLETANVVKKLEAAGAILIGKTNMDQFATGLVGVRSPYGACADVFHPEYISGGSSSGSAIAVAKGLISFALGTDTAGSGRVPAAFNNIIGLKPTRGLISTHGVLPACRTLDCVSIFALTCRDAATILEATQGFDQQDAFSRTARATDAAAAWSQYEFRFGVPPDDQLQFFGDPQTPTLFRKAVEALESLGGAKVEIDLTPFRAVADLLYLGPWVAERLAAIEHFVDAHEQEMHPVVRTIITGARRYSATDVFKSEYLLAELRAKTMPTWNTIDFLFLPTASRIYKILDVETNPISLNTNLGYYTNFVNLLDLAAIALPAGFTTDGLPFGVSVIGQAFAETALLSTADGLHRKLNHTVGGLPDKLAETRTIEAPRCPPGFILIAVVGAHLKGQPLNWQLTSRRGRLIATTTTDSTYRLFALRNTTPAKPGLLQEPGFAGPGIEVEIWALPEISFGSFVDQIPSPLGIGKLRLIDGTIVSGFICEPAALENAAEITNFGGWRNYLKSS